MRGRWEVWRGGRVQALTRTEGELLRRMKRLSDDEGKKRDDGEAATMALMECSAPAVVKALWTMSFCRPQKRALQ